MTHDVDSLASLMGEGGGADEPDSLARVVAEGRGGAGVEAEVALARLRSRMFGAGEAEVRVGRYRVLAPIGRGGMGVVYRAHDPALGRDVALKLLRGDSAGHERRLRREARAMARLSHPNVVAVLEVGRYEDEAFVVMELVPGRDAAAWLVARDRPWREVLEAFLAAGRGLAAAHAVGLVHRDFKPSNVLVGDDGRVRVTDFGLAASGPEVDGIAAPGTSEPGIEPHARSQGITTATGARVGTPRYMAPEQHRGERVDHRADQWAFAVSLWEALYGEHPFVDAATGQLDLERPLPPRPGSRRGVPAAIGRALARALAREPERRHASMEALLARLSADRRRRMARGLAAVGVLAVAAVGLASAPQSVPRCDPEAALAGTWSPDRRAALARGFAETSLPFAQPAWVSVETRVDDWEQRWSEAYRTACEAGADAQLMCLRGDLAELRALLDLLEAPDRALVVRAERATRDLPIPERCADPRPALAGADAATLAAHEERMAEVRALGRAGRYTDARRLAAATLDATPDVPRLRAEAQLSLGLNENRSGDSEAAAASLRAAYYAAATTEEPDLTARAALAMANVELRRADYERTEEWLRHAAPWVERVDDVKRRDELQQEALFLTGELHYDQGRYDEALAWLERARAVADDETSPIGPRLLNLLGLVHVERGEHDRAAEVFVRAVGIESRRSGVMLHPEAASAISNLGNVHWYRGEYDEAERAYQQAYEIQREALGPEHRSTLNSILNLGIVAEAKGDRPRAAALLEQVVAVRAATLGPEHPETAHAMVNLAATLISMGEVERSLELYRKALAIFDASLGLEHSRAIEARFNYAISLNKAGRVAEAFALLEQVLASTAAAHGLEREIHALALREQAVSLRRVGDFTEAERRDRLSLARLERLWGPEHPELASGLSAIADAAVQSRRFEEGAVFAERALAVGPRSAAFRGKAGYLLARALWGSRRDLARVPQILDQAERELTEAGEDASHILQNLRRFRAEAGVDLH